MGVQLFANNAATTLATPCSDVATEITLTDGSIFPSPTAGDWFLLTLYQLSGAQEVNHEILKCTARVVNVLTVSRAFEDATRFPARSYTAGNFAELRDTAGTRRIASSIDNVPAGNIAATTVQAAINELDTEKEAVANKDAAGGYAGLTLFKLNLKNAANTFTNFLTNATTDARTWMLPDKDGTVAMTSDITGTNSGTNTGDNATNSQYSGLVTNATHTGDATGSGALTVVAINGTNMAALATGILKNTTTTGAPSIAAAGTDYVSPAGTEILTNKRVTPRILSAASYTTDTGTSLNCDNLDEFIVTAQAGALKLNNPTGTPTDGQCLFVAVTGTAARALTYDTQFQASTVALPTTTVTTARLNMGFIWDAATSKWIIVGAV